ncbi:unnamed protein product [Caenorhabditis auriculariae]|uniref:SXP/RAL-2 family protein Ani s 5-like cation-binding domain-containing protein n=1 Tax=Caenorhabditis auriculariae TaxID=2777116 RepID=A0A8S1HED9_9PELO|nr:unnamed protein product [Caenorhabditis auriculariae]
MYKIFFVAIALFVVCAADDAVEAANEAAAKAVQDMKDAGLSEAAIGEIEKLGQKHEEDIKNAISNPEQAETALKALKTDIDAYIETASEADQAAWKTYEEKTKARIEELAQDGPK